MQPEKNVFFPLTPSLRRCSINFNFFLCCFSSCVLLSTVRTKVLTLFKLWINTLWLGIKNDKWSIFRIQYDILLTSFLFQTAGSGQDGGPTSHHRDHYGHQATQGEQENWSQASSQPASQPGSWLISHDTRPKVEAATVRGDRDVRQ